jgi:tRNA modification GTPase
LYVKDTIAAIVTPPGSGGIGVIRLSGPAAVSISADIFMPSHAAAPSSHRLRHGILADPDGEPIDEVLAAVMYQPRSYTGEDVVEFHCHGSPVVLAQALGLCLRAGARLADPGEFTKRAFLNGRLDLVQAEAVGELIASRTAAAARTSLRHLAGALSRELAEIRAAMLAVKARAEALIDFSEEELDLDPTKLLSDIDAARARVDALVASFQRGHLLHQGAHLVLVGRPNVGKSSLLNALLGRDRAIVTAVPGTTRDVLAESVEINGIPVVIADTAGLRAEAEGIERMGIQRARDEAAAADGVLLVLDGSAPLQADDHSALAASGGTPAIAVVNKRDLPPAWDPVVLDQLRGIPLVQVSALTRAGIADLQDAIARLLGAAEIDAHVPMVTLIRHRDALQRVGESLGLARNALAQRAPIDLVAVDIQIAVEHIGSVTGEITSEEVLDRIFSEFCIGK